jgi:hypothetical protein
MSLITKMRKQKAVYWPPSTRRDQYGRPIAEAAVEIDCRWEDRTDEFITTTGERQLSNALVYVDRDIVLGGVLLLGTLDTVMDITDPKNNEGAFEVLRFDKMPNLKGTEFLRTAYL